MSTSAAPNPAPMDPVRSRIDAVAADLWRAELLRRGLTLAAIILAIGWVWVLLDHWVYSPPRLGRWMFGVAAFAVVTAIIVRRIVPLLTRGVSRHYAARVVERDHPELRGALSAYVDLGDVDVIDPIERRVLEAVGTDLRHRLSDRPPAPDEAVVPIPLWLIVPLLAAGALAYAAASPKSVSASVLRLMAPAADIEPPSRVRVTNVTPGDVTVPAGRPVRIAAMVDAVSDRDAVVVETRRGNTTPMRRSSATTPDDTHEASLPLPPSSVEPIDYRVRAGDAASRWYRLSVAPIPVVTIRQVRIEPPAYTGLPPRRSSAPAIRGPDGSRVTLNADVSRPVTAAHIEFNPRTIGDTTRATAGSIPATVNTETSPASITATFDLRGPTRDLTSRQIDSYRIVVESEDSVTGFEPIVHPIEILEDLPPEISVATPRNSPKDLPLDAIQAIELHASDPDYGLSEISLSIRAGSRNLPGAVLFVPEPGKAAPRRRVVEYRVRPGSLDVGVGQTLTVVASATDNRDITLPPAAGPQTVRSSPIKLRIVAPESPGEDPSRPDPRRDDGGPSGSDGSSEDADGMSGGSGGDGEDAQPSDEASGGTPQSGDGGGNEGKEGQSTGGSDPSSGDDANDRGSTSPDRSDRGESSDGKPGGDSSDAAGDDGTSGSDGDPSQPGRSSETDSAGVQSPAGGPGSAGDDPAERSETDPSSPGEGTSASNEDEGASSPATHDGEAFERIRDYLEEQNSGSDDRSPNRDSPGDSDSQGTSGQRGDQGSRFADERGGPSEPREADDRSDNNQPSDGQRSGEPSSEGEPRSSNRNEGAGSEDRDGEGGSAPNEPPAENDSGGGRSADGAPSEEPPNTSTESNNRPGSGPDGGPADSPSDSSRDAPTDAGDRESSSGDAGEGGVPRPSGDDRPQSSDNSDDSGASGGSDAPTPGVNDGDRSDAAAPQSPSKGSGSPTSSGSRRPGVTDDRTGDSGDSNAASSDAEPADEANLEYAREATDMVLDHLRRQRDVDPELLERLGWNEEQLRAFQRRWERTLRPEAADNPDRSRSINLDDTLRSLGLQGRRGSGPLPAASTEESIEGLRDAGGRGVIPPAHRDAFDAFRRRLSGGRR